jgi:hypothetical protein
MRSKCPRSNALKNTLKILGDSGFDSAVCRKRDAKWHFPQENAALHDLQM